MVRRRILRFSGRTATLFAARTEIFEHREDCRAASCHCPVRSFLCSTFLSFFASYKSWESESSSSSASFSDWSMTHEKVRKSWTILSLQSQIQSAKLSRHQIVALYHHQWHSRKPKNLESISSHQSQSKSTPSSSILSFNPKSFARQTRSRALLSRALFFHFVALFLCNSFCSGRANNKKKLYYVWATTWDWGE